MPQLTRRRYRERQDCWHVYFGDVHVGTIARRVGIPHSGKQWGWICGFYPGSKPGEFRDGTAATFDQARADFAVAWQRFSAKRTEADYQAWRNQRDWTAEKYRRFDRGEWTAHDLKPPPEYGGLPNDRQTNRVLDRSPR